MQHRHDVYYLLTLIVKLQSSLSDSGEPLCLLVDILLQENTESLHSLIHLKAT